MVIADRGISLTVTLDVDDGDRGDCDCAVSVVADVDEGASGLGVLSHEGPGDDDCVGASDSEDLVDGEGEIGGVGVCSVIVWHTFSTCEVVVI